MSNKAEVSNDEDTDIDDNSGQVNQRVKSSQGVLNTGQIRSEHATFNFTTHQPGHPESGSVPGGRRERDATSTSEDSSTSSVPLSDTMVKGMLNFMILLWNISGLIFVEEMYAKNSFESARMGLMGVSIVLLTAHGVLLTILFCRGIIINKYSKKINTAANMIIILVFLVNITTFGLSVDLDRLADILCRGGKTPGVFNGTG